MSSTNKTPNYQLSQFVGSDKPAWLADYNQDMSKIDAGIETAKNTGLSAEGKADTANTSIGTLTNLNTTDKTNLVNAVNEVKSNADTAINASNNALQTANTANGTVNDLASYFNLNSSVDVQTSQMSILNGTINNADFKVVKNSSGTLAKIYGTITATPSVSGANTISVNIDTGLRPANDIVIGPAGTVYPSTATVGYKIKTNGRIDINFYASGTSQITLLLFPCLYFIQDFGDQ